jgi:hypothetical protein
MSRRGWLGAALVSAAIAGLLLAVLLPRESDDSGGRTPVLVATQTIPRVLTSSHVKKAFAHQGLDLAPYEVGPGIPALGYPVGAEGTQAMRITCEIYSDSVTARGVVRTHREKRPVGIARALRAKNVAVLLDPAATPDDVRRTLRAVAELRRG